MTAMTLHGDIPGGLLRDAAAVAAGAAPAAGEWRLVLLVGPGLAEHNLADDGPNAVTRLRALHVDDMAQALAALRHMHVDALVLEQHLLLPRPALALSQLREQLDCALLVLARHADEVDEVIALEHGADDFIALPLSPRRLKARVLAHLRCQGTLRMPMALPALARQSGAPAFDSVTLHGWHLDARTQVLSYGVGQVTLTGAQCALLHVLMRRAGQLCPVHELASALRSRGAQPEPEHIPVYVHRLRQRLQAPGLQGLHIAAVRGRGFVLHAKAPGGPEVALAAGQIVAQAGHA